MISSGLNEMEFTPHYEDSFWKYVSLQTCKSVGVQHASVLILQYSNNCQHTSICQQFPTFYLDKFDSKNKLSSRKMHGNGPYPTHQGFKADVKPTCLCHIRTKVHRSDVDLCEMRTISSHVVFVDCTRNYGSKIRLFSSSICNVLFYFVFVAVVLVALLHDPTYWWQIMDTYLYLSFLVEIKS